MINKFLPFNPNPYRKPIGLRGFIEKYKIPITGVIHVGAHYGQEVREYRSCSIEDITLIEPLPKCFNKLVEKFGNEKCINLVNKAIGDKKGKLKMFVDSKLGESSSLLKPKEHLKSYPSIKFKKSTFEVDVVTLDSLEFVHLYNLINIDVQGYEDRVIRGGKKTIAKADYLFVEVNLKEMYSSCYTVDKIDKLLKEFQRVSTRWQKEDGWGEAMYIKKSKL